MPNPIDKKRVTVRAPELADTREAKALLSETEAALIEDVFVLDQLEGTGHERGDFAEDKHGINTAMEKLSVLDSRLGPKLEATLARNGSVGRKLAARIKESRGERQKLDRTKAPRFAGISKNPGTTPEILGILHRRRTKNAKAEAKRIETNPEAAANVSNDSLQIHAWMKDEDARARTLVDTLLQFRAEWRSTANMDEVIGPRDTSQGKLASSGIVGTFEARLAAQEAPTGDDFEASRERALLRLAIVNHPQDTISSIFLARNLASSLRALLGRTLSVDYVGEGIHAVPLYMAIHQNYSAATPLVVDEWTRTILFTGGDEAARVDIISTLVDAAQDKDLERAKRRLARLEERTGYAVPGGADALEASELTDRLRQHLVDNSTYDLDHLESDEQLEVFRQGIALRGTVCSLSSSDVTLRQRLFYGKDAATDVAKLIRALEGGDSDAILESASSARLALAKTFAKTKGGFDRQMLWRLDRQVEQIHAAELGSAVKRLSTPSQDPAELGRGLLAMRSALRSTVASDLHHLRHREKTTDSPDLDVLLKRTDSMLSKIEAGKKVDVGTVRELMQEVLVSATEVANAMDIMLRRREKAVHFGGVEVGLDPEVTDNLVKETALHYLIGLAQAGSSWGIAAKISPNKITFAEGMKVLNPVGPTVYERILIADDLEELKRLHPTENDFCVVKSMDEKEKALVAVGGLALDASDAPPGFSHVSVFARGQGISALGFPNLADDYLPFFERVQGQDGVSGARLFTDDSDGQLTLMPLADAIREGRIKRNVTDPKKIETEDLTDFRPGASYEHRYHESVDGVRRLLDEHRIDRGTNRGKKIVDVLVPDLENKSAIPDVPTLAELGTLPTTDDMIQNAGMKGAVLADLQTCDELKEIDVDVPGGAVVSPHVVVDLLRKADVFDEWLGAYFDAPTDTVPERTVEDMLGTRFYKDTDHRDATVDRLRAQVTEGLEALLIKGRGPTPEGRALLDAIGRAEELSDGSRKVPWIARSSQTIEDLLHKSGAGQHSSVADLESDVKRLQGIVEVIASHWSNVALDNNVRGEMNVLHDWPSVVVQRTVQTRVSGVAVSRGERGQLGKIGYQAVPGRGGGVAGAESWELGHLGQWDHEPEQLVEGNSRSLLTNDQRWQLWRATQIIEKRLNERFAPDSEVPLAVDVEWGIEKGRLCIYQARFATGY